MWDRIREGRTDEVFTWVAGGGGPSARDPEGVSLLQWCAYYGDVSAVRFLERQGASLEELGENFDLPGAAFHGHWRLVQFLLERGAQARQALADTGETPLHLTFCRSGMAGAEEVADVLLAHGSDPNQATRAGVPTGAFMRDARTRGETPLHRAAAFGSERAIRALLAAGGDRERADARGETPLAWASWQGRPDAILRLLCFGDYGIAEGRPAMGQALLGRPRF